MKIDRVVLENFRQYFGKQRVVFAQDTAKNITLFHGANGAGKTSFFSALNWCLYGEGVENIGQIISKEAVQRASVGEMVHAQVDIVFNHEGQRYIATRKIKGIKQPHGTVQEQRDVEFMLMRTGFDGQTKMISNPIGTINAILPSTVRTYFFFDGEKIDNFARPEAGREVKTAIYQVLNLEILTRAKNHLAAAARELRGELKGLVGDELKALIAQDEEARQQQSDLLRRQEEIKREMEAAKRHVAEVNQQLRDLEAVQAQQAQYELFSQQITARQSEFASLINRIRELASQGYVSVAADAYTKALIVLNEKRQRGEIPSNIRKQFVQDLLDRGICICGRAFSEHEPAHIQLMQLLEHAVPRSLEDDVLNTSSSLNTLAERGCQISNDLTTAMTEKVRLQDLIKDLHEQRDDVERQMKGSGQVEVSALANKRDQYQADIEEYRTELVRIELELESIKRRISELDREIGKARKQEHREQLLSRKVELAQQSSDAIGDIYDGFAEQMRQQIEARTREIFRTLVWKGSHFQDVRLTPDYQLEVIDRYNSAARPELSAGERQVLSLSFIMGMAGVAQREAPLVMDTPFGRLSSAHRDSITSTLPELAHQLVLFVTDEELRDQALSNLEPLVGAEYILHFDPRTSVTTIEKA